MVVVVEFFKRCLEFDHHDVTDSSDSHMQEWLCRLIEQVSWQDFSCPSIRTVQFFTTHLTAWGGCCFQLGPDEVSATFKDLWLRNGLTVKVIDFFLSHATVITTGSPESQEFKKCVGRISMK